LAIIIEVAQSVNMKNSWLLLCAVAGLLAATGGVGGQTVNITQLQQEAAAQAQAATQTAQQASQNATNAFIQQAKDQAGAHCHLAFIAHVAL
jgi:uncharacterized membrane protein YebE (DUF533 family)